MSDACHHFWNVTKHHKTLTFCSLLTRRTIPRPCHAKRHLNVQKWSQHVVSFDLETCFTPQRRALFNISSSKSAPKLVCFVHFDFEMCFAPQRRAMACTFSTSQLPKVLREWCVLHILTATACNLSSLIWPDGSAPAALPSLLFDPPEPQSIGKTWKNSVSRLFYLFARPHLLSSDSFSSLIFFLLLFSSLTLPTSAFSSVHIVRSLTSQLPSIRYLSLIF